MAGCTVLATVLPRDVSEFCVLVRSVRISSAFVLTAAMLVDSDCAWLAVEAAIAVLMLAVEAAIAVLMLAIPVLLLDWVLLRLLLVLVDSALVFCCATEVLASVYAFALLSVALSASVITGWKLATWFDTLASTLFCDVK